MRHALIVSKIIGVRTKFGTLFDKATMMTMMKAALLVFTLVLPLTCATTTTTTTIDNSTLFTLGDKNASVHIVTLELVDTPTMTTIATPLVDGLVIALDTVPGMTTPSFNIRATLAAASNNNESSVVFGYNNVSNFRIDNFSPYAFCGNQGSILFPCSELGLGTHTVTATPFSALYAQGEAGPTVNVTFSIVPSTPTTNTTTGTQPSNDTMTVPKSTNRTCNIPKLVGRWRRVTSYPLNVAEAQGGMIGNTTFLLVGGFKDSFNATAREAYSLDTSNEAAGWTRHDDMPSRVGITHAGFAVVGGTKFYMCGGYLGGTPGRHTHRCLVLDPSRPAGKQWSSFRSLPGGGRGGGGMVYDSTLDALIFSGGAQRPVANSYVTVDYNTTWMYSLRNALPGARWIPKAALPYHGNHISFVTATDAMGKERHYFLGGQDGENEADGNKVDHYEYNVTTDTWIPRQNLPRARGHSSSSTRPFGCGYLMAGGATNGQRKLSDIGYYHIPTDSWTSIGDLPKALNTPVCDIATQGNDETSSSWLYCASGFIRGKFDYKIQIV